MIANIDGDLITYPCAASCAEDDPVDVAITRCDKLITEILEQTKCDAYRVYVSSHQNFRKEVNKEYKANRKDMIPPKWLQDCKEFLITEWNAKISEWHEADDLLGINQEDDTILCSFDKDMLMIPGSHYNWKKREYKDVLYLDGLKHFYKQMLIGDRSDNVIGVDGIGPVKADRYINNLETEQEMFDQVFDLYNEDINRFLINGTCLWILRQEGTTWLHHLKTNQDLTFPIELQQEQERLLSSMSFLTNEQ